MKSALWVPSYRGSLLLSRLLCSLTTSLHHCPQALDYTDIYISINTSVNSPEIQEYKHLESLYSSNFKFVWNVNQEPLDVVSHFNCILRRHKTLGLQKIGILGDDEIVAENFFLSLYQQYFTIESQPELFIFRSHLIDSKAHIFYLNEKSKSIFWNYLTSSNYARIRKLAVYAPWDELVYGFHDVRGLSRLLRLIRFFLSRNFLSGCNLACALYTRIISNISISEDHIIGSSTSIPIIFKSNLFGYPKLTDRVYRTLISEDPVGRRPISNNESSSFFHKIVAFIKKIISYAEYSFFITNLPTKYWRQRPNLLFYFRSTSAYASLFALSIILSYTFFILRCIASSINLLAINLNLKPFLHNH